MSKMAGQRQLIENNNESILIYLHIKVDNLLTESLDEGDMPYSILYTIK